MHIYRVDLIDECYGELYGINTEYVVSDKKYTQDEFKCICDKAFSEDDYTMCNISDKLSEYEFRSIQSEAEYDSSSSKFKE